MNDIDVGVITVFVIVVGVLLWLVFGFKTRKYDVPDPAANIESKNIDREGYRPIQLYSQMEGKRQTNWTIYNHLLKPIALECSADGKTIGFELKIPGRSSKTYSQSIFEKHFADGNTVRGYIYDDTKPGLGRELHVEFTLDTPGAVIKTLNIGMITSRWVAGATGYEFKPPNAVDGMPYIKIKNQTNNFLTLNGSINISPNGMLRFTGRDHYGVRLGTIFRDTNGVYPDYVLTERCTHVYYGITSDLLQPLHGEMQIFEDFDESPPLTRFPMQHGAGALGGGPAVEKIDPNFLPLLGTPVVELDRWGLK